MVIMLFPFSIFHNHQENAHIACNEDIEIENDLCHISIFHNESLKEQCKHESHLSNLEESCEFCKFISRRFQFTTEESSSISSLEFSSITRKKNSIFITRHSNKSTQGRAPPTT